MLEAHFLFIISYACIVLQYYLYFQNYDDGTSDKPYGHALVAGIERYPRRIIRKMGKKKQKERSKIKPFVRVYNYNHLMPTR